MKKQLVKFFAGLLVTTTFFLAFCKKQKTATPQPYHAAASSADTVITPFPVTQVYVLNYHFSPANVSIQRGSSISWTNRDSISHTVTSRDGTFESGDLGPGKTYLYNFPNEGYTSYYCRYHKEGGNITVH